MRKVLRGASRNLRLMHAIRVFSLSASLVVPNLVLFVASHGVSQRDFFLLEIVFAAIFGLLQVPTGRYADRFGRRSALIVGSSLLFLSMTFYVGGSSLQAFLVAEVFAAMGLAFMSGADEALFYESLVVLKRGHHHGRMWSRVFLFGFLAMSAGNLIGGALTTLSSRAPFVAAAGGFAVLTLLAFCLQESEHHRKDRTEENPPLREVLAEVLVRRSEVRWLILFSMVPMLALQASLWTYQNYFLMCGVGSEWHGLVLAVFNLCAAAAASQASRFAQGLGKARALTLPMVVIGVGFLLMAASPTWASLLVIGAQQFARGFMPGVYSGYLNPLLPKECRATALSVKSGYELMWYVALLLMARYAVGDHGAVLSALWILGVVVVVHGALGMLLRPQLNEATEVSSTESKRCLKAA